MAKSKGVVAKNKTEEKVLQLAAFELDPRFIEKSLLSLYGLEFPYEWLEPLKALQEEKTGRPDNTLPIKSLNSILATFVPHLAAMPNATIKSRRDQSSEEGNSSPWLLAREDVSVDKIWLVIQAWLKLNYRDCPGFSNIRSKLNRQDLKSWLKLDELVFQAEPALKNGTASLCKLAYTALPVWLADELVRKEVKVPVYGQQRELVRVPTDRGAELITWPPARVPSTNNNKKADSYFSYVIKITVQTIAGSSQPRIHFHYGVRCWVSQPLTDGNRLWLGGSSRSVYLYRTKPWLGLEDTDIFTVTKIKAITPPDIDESSSGLPRKVAEWDNLVPDIASALQVKFPSAQELVNNPVLWLTQNDKDGIIAAIPEKTPRFHAVGKGMGLEDHARITEIIAQALKEQLLQSTAPQRLQKLTNKDKHDLVKDLREIPVE